MSEVEKADGFPSSIEIANKMYQYLLQLTGLDTAKLLKNTAISFPLKRLEGVYIATRFSSYCLGVVTRKGSKLLSVFFDKHLNVVRRAKSKVPYGFSKLEIDKDAKLMLNDYVALTLKRPYLSLACTLSESNGAPVPLNLLAGYCGAISLLDASATVISSRDKLNSIDPDTLREIISFCEGNILGSFIRPDKVRGF